jgi:epoxyqueuosine reductase
MGNWLFGCDVCQDVCPWNRKPPRSDERMFQPLDSLAHADAIALLSLREEEFAARFHDSPLARPGRAGLLRNAAIVLGNDGDARAIDPLVAALADAAPLGRGAAAWALGRFDDPRAREALKARTAVEDNADVQLELQSAMTPNV